MSLHPGAGFNHDYDDAPDYDYNAEADHDYDHFGGTDDYDHHGVNDHDVDAGTVRRCGQRWNVG